jgi:hypothetical protein
MGDPMPQLPSDSATKSNSEHEFVLLVEADREGLQLGLGQNLFQLASLVVCAAIGATTGWFMTDDRPDLAALAGSVLGMMAGTFLSGFALMLIPSSTVSVSLHEFQKTQSKLNRRLVAAAVAFAASMLAFPLVLWRFGHDESDLAWCMCLFWLCLTTGLCAYSKGLAYRVRVRKDQLSADRVVK